MYVERSAAEEQFKADALERRAVEEQLKEKGAEDKAAHGAREEEIDAILLRQGFEADAAASEKKAYWAAYAEEVVDLVSNEE
jgi:hypothetical protein